MLILHDCHLECLVIVASDFCEEVKTRISLTCEVSGLQISTVFVDIPESDLDQGSIVALKHVRSQLTANTVLLLSCDLICDVPLNVVANVHRINNSSLTILLGHSGPPRTGADNTQDEERKKWQTKGEGLDR